MSDSFGDLFKKLKVNNNMSNPKDPEEQYYSVPKPDGEDDMSWVIANELRLIRFGIFRIVEKLNE